MEYLVLGFVLIFGLFVGSFLNVVIYRLPRECLSVVKQTRSRCPRCGVQLAWYDNIPLVSFLFLLRGRCRRCKAPISWRYPMIEGFTALVFAGLAWRLRGWEGLEYPFIDPESWGVLGVQVTVTASLIALSVIDMDYRILPDALTLPGIVLAPVMVFLVPAAMPAPCALIEGGTTWAPRWNALLNGLAGEALAAGVLWMIGWLGSKAFRKPAMGLGDVKLYAAMGGVLGFWVLLVLPLASILGSVIGVAVLLVKKDHYVPFGPFLALGMVVTMTDGPRILEVVLQWLGR